MALGLTELGSQKRLDEVPGREGPNDPSPNAENVHVIVFHALPSREVIVHERGTDASDLVGTDRRANAAAAHRDTALDLSPGDGPRERDDEVRIVVGGIQMIRAEIHDVVSCRAETSDEFFFQTKATMISGDSHINVGSYLCPALFLSSR